MEKVILKRDDFSINYNPNNNIYELSLIHKYNNFGYYYGFNLKENDIEFFDKYFKVKNKEIEILYSTPNFIDATMFKAIRLSKFIDHSDNIIENNYQNQLKKR